MELSEIEVRDDGLDEAVEDLDDFDSEDLEEFGDAADDDRNSFISGMWTRYGLREDRGSSAESREEALIVAHGMVQTFMNTFATSEGGYRVAFDTRVDTAGTDFQGKLVLISPGPIFDDTITAHEAGLILTGMACHEASHDRYGRGTGAAVRRVFGQRQLPHQMSNILDDARIEKRFAREWPGYKDVFLPTRRYVARGMMKRRGMDPDTEKIKHEITQQVSVASGAVLYPEYIDWSDARMERERVWWQGWASRWAAEDSPRRHVEGIRESLRHVAQVRAADRMMRERNEKRIASANPAMFERVRKGLGSLPELERRALALAVKGATGPQIADALGLSLIDARRTLAHARLSVARGGRS